MLERIINEQLAGGQPYKAQPVDTAILKMKTQERQGGSIPVWERPLTGGEQVRQRLNLAEERSFESFIGTQAFTEPDNGPFDETNAEKPFGFGDLVDMVNPLHHVPLLGNLYREVTGDEIRDISKIMGGAVYGGPAGAASGVINAAVKEETGSDIPGLVTANLSRDSLARNGSAVHNSPEQEISEEQIIAGTQAYQASSRLAGHNVARDPQQELQDIGRSFISDRAKSLLGNIVTVADLNAR